MEGKSEPDTQAMVIGPQSHCAELGLGVRETQPEAPWSNGARVLFVL